MLQDLCLWRDPRPRARFLLVAGVLAQVFLDAGRFAFQPTQVVELGTAHFAAALDRDGIDRRAVRLEHALHARAVRDLAHGESRVEAGILLRDAHAFVGLHALAVAFLHLDVDDDRVAGPEFGQLAGHLLGFELLEDVHDTHRSWVDYTQMLSRIGPHLTSFLYLLDIQSKVFCLPLTA